LIAAANAETTNPGAKTPGSYFFAFPNKRNRKDAELSHHPAQRRGVLDRSELGDPAVEAEDVAGALDDQINEHARKDDVMPEFRFDPGQVGDVIAYLKYLEQ
jgi:hypothetical protein